MFLRTWRFITLLLTALLMGTTFCHLLEMPGKMAASAPVWLTFQHNLYHNFATVGGFVELGAIFAALVLVLLSRQRKTAFYFSWLAAVCVMSGFFVVWLLFTNVVNIETARWTAATIPPDWNDWRVQWEASHAVRCALHILAFGALSASFLSEIPTGRDAKELKPAKRKSVLNLE